MSGSFICDYVLGTVYENLVLLSLFNSHVIPIIQTTSAVPATLLLPTVINPIISSIC